MAIHQKNIASNLTCESKKENQCPDKGKTISGSLSENTYPKRYEKKLTRTGLVLFMRPIKPEDAPLLLNMFNKLSPGTRYYRFFTPLKVLPKDLLMKFTNIDYKKEPIFILCFTFVISMSYDLPIDDINKK